MKDQFTLIFGIQRFVFGELFGLEYTVLSGMSIIIEIGILGGFGHV